MKTIDRIIFGTIAFALLLIALQPYIARADRVTDINIHSVAGKALRFGEPLPTK